jgi:hypothetical protein
MTDTDHERRGYEPPGIAERVQFEAPLIGLSSNQPPPP